jgi:hypothetical protein
VGISVGSVSVDVVPSTRGFSEKLKAELRNTSVQVRADLDDKKLKGELDAATRDRTVNVKVDDHGSIANTEKNSHALLTTLVGLAPAVAPLAGVAVAGTAALGALGATGLLAFQGIKAAMKEGTQTGLAYTGVVGTLKGDLASLEQVAAKGILHGFTDAATVADRAVPQLRTEVGLLAKSLGSDLTPVTAGVLGLMRDLDPTINNISGGIHSLAVDFRDWATGPGGVKFAAYLAQTLPQVEHTLGSLASAGAHLVQALLPLGGTVLGAIKGISDAISAIPVQVIEDLFLAFAAYKTVQLATTATTAFTAALRTLGIVSGATSVKLDALAASEAAASGGGKVGKFASIGAAGGPAAAITAALAGGYIVSQDIGANNRTDQQNRVNALQSPGALAAAQQQLAALRAQIAAAPSSNPQIRGPQSNTSVQQHQYASLSKDVDLATKALKAQQAANLAAGLTADGTKDAVTGETTAMKALITSTDKAATAAQGLYGANINVHQSLSDANKALKTNGETLDLNTQKGRDNRTALLNVASALRSKIDAEAADGAKAPKIKADQDTAITQLEHIAEKFGIAKTKAHDYALALLGIKPVVSTKVVLTGVKGDLSQIADLKASLHLSPTTPGGRVTPARGGHISGPGTGTSDSIPAMVSNGEFVVNARATAANLALLHKINSATPAYARGGLVGYASGGIVGDADLSGISSLFSGTTFSTKANVTSARQSLANATAALAGAEATLRKAQNAKHPDPARVHADEARVAADRQRAATATRNLAAAEKSYAASRQPVLTRFSNAATSDTKTTGAFISNLLKLRAKGDGYLAEQLLEDYQNGDSNAPALAAQAVASQSKAKSLQQTLQTSANQQTALVNLAAGGTNALYGPKGTAAGTAAVQVTQNITTQPGMSETAVGQIAAGQLAMALSK